MSFINKEVADFTATAYQTGEFKEVSKKDLLGHWSVMFFYPADFTFVWPTELKDLGAKYEAFKKLGCEIYAISCDTHFIHKAWADVSDSIKNLGYPMVGDPTHELAKAFDVMIEEAGISERGTFIINPEGQIVSYEVSAGNVGRNAKELLRKVYALQHVYENKEQAAPAGWEPGQDALTPSIELIGKL